MKGKRKREKPETVQVGNAVVKIYPHRKHLKGRKRPYITWQVADFSLGDRRFKTFADHGKAVREAERIARATATGHAVAAGMSNAQAQSYGRCIAIIRPTGDSLETACERYARIVQILGSGAKAEEAALAFVQRDRVPYKTVAEVVKEMIADKERNHREERTIADLKNRLAKFAESFACPIATITKSDIQQWLDKMKTSSRDRLNYRSKVNTLFRWAWRRDYVLSNPVEKTERPEADDGQVEIYSPAELQRLIAAATKEFLPCLVIGAFAGLRSSEILRLTWGDVNLARGFITASAKKRGTPSRRLVLVQPNLSAWLCDYTEKKGNVWPGTPDQFSQAQQDTAAATEVKANEKKGTEAQAPVPWKHNGLRHSFCSYRLAILQDDRQTALEAGNSPETIHGHYKELVTPDDARLWFAIAPEKPENLLSLAKTARP